MVRTLYDRFQKIKKIKGKSLLIADDDLIVTVANMKNAAYTIAAQPILPSLIAVTHIANGTVDTLGIVTVVGTLNGVAQTEVITPVNGTTVYGAKYFDAITSVTGSGWTIAAGNDTIKVGVGASSVVSAKGSSMSFYVLSGNVWINHNVAAVADSTSLLITADTGIDLIPKDNLYFITDSSGAYVEYVIWDEE